MVKDRTPQKFETDDLGPALGELVGSLEPAQLENVAILSIREHRRLRALAERPTRR